MSGLRIAPSLNSSNVISSGSFCELSAKFIYQAHVIIRTLMMALKNSLQMSLMFV
jgi:hypothetical protein